MNLQPLSIFLVKNGQGGDLVLFRYPYKVAGPKKASSTLESESRNHLVDKTVAAASAVASATEAILATTKKEALQQAQMEQAMSSSSSSSLVIIESKVKFHHIFTLFLRI